MQDIAYWPNHWIIIPRKYPIISLCVLEISPHVHVCHDCVEILDNTSNEKRSNDH